jgi:tetratricopeptide (TPR) repeat protein
MAAVALLTGCATQGGPPAGPPVVVVAPPVEPAVPLAEQNALVALEARHAQAAAAAEQQSSWPQALTSLDVLLALRPADAELAARRARAQQAAQAAGADRTRRAKLAQQKGDAEGAARLYLEALAQDPSQTEAADALRGFERERLRRTVLAAARGGTAGRAGTAAARGEAVPAPSTGMPGADRNEVEHASLLAAQGEVEAAITLLKPISGGRSADPMARSLLADLYVRQAQALLPADRAGAMAALERAVQTDPGNPRAAAQLQQLKRGARPDSAGK